MGCQASYLKLHDIIPPRLGSGTCGYLKPATLSLPLSTGTGKRFPDGPCLAGYYCPPGQTSATPMSFRCPRGFYCPEGSPQPKACGNGTFQPQEAQGSCELCPMGFYCEASSSGRFLELVGDLSVWGSLETLLIYFYWDRIFYD